MEEAQMKISHLFTCPISLDLFTDPVTLCTGHTYDRPSIEKWLAAGNLTCPITMQKLHDPSLVPNHTLRHLIEQWRQMCHRLDPDYFSTLDPLATLKHSLESHKVSFEEKRRTLEGIQVIAEESPSTGSLLLQLGFLPLLLRLIFEKVELEAFNEYEKFAKEALLWVLRLSSLGELGSLNMLRGGSTFESFLLLFERGCSEIKTSLCHLVEAVSSSSETKALCTMIGNNPRFLHGILLLLHQNADSSEAGVRAISALRSSESNRENLVQAGIINGLVIYILNSDGRERSLAGTSMTIIEQLLELETGKEAVINSANHVKALVKMVFRVSDHEGSESAVNSLMIICQESLQAREKAIAAGVLTQLLLLLQSQCSGRTKTKARMLLKLLRSKWDEDQKFM
ncbi:hypothetical protein SLEP1_g31582 [Rubroshorea leprosula]|uniref:U-box domain-containing protein n=1 Tax=Rubroshorea leprosula TaxID=152421 RepID=A0AAV5K8R5_9ROSI|nr:hypothetical protein SLEP1_g31582 [Rubroshorea leprosula]